MESEGRCCCWWLTILEVKVSEVCLVVFSESPEWACSVVSGRRDQESPEKRAATIPTGTLALEKALTSLLANRALRENPPAVFSNPGIAAVLLIVGWLIGFGALGYTGDGGRGEPWTREQIRRVYPLALTPFIPDRRSERYWWGSPSQN